MPLLIAEPSGEVYVFDGIMEESIDDSANVTEHPVENLLFITDHRQRMPTKLKVTGVVSGTPIIGFAQNREFILGGPARLQDCKDFFDRTQDDSVYTYVSIYLGRFTDLMLESVGYQVGENKDNMLKVSLDFKQIRVGNSQEVELPPIRVPDQEPPTDEGEQDGEEEDPEDIRSQTYLNQITDFAEQTIDVFGNLANGVF